MKKPTVKKIKRKTRLPSEVLRGKCVTAAKKIVRIEAGYICEYCGKQEPEVRTHGSHIYSEGIYRSMSADLDNILCLCFTHHIGGWNAKEPSWHKNPVEMVDWFKEKYPARAEDLKTRKSVQADLHFWKEKWSFLSEKLEKLSTV